MKHSTKRLLFIFSVCLNIGFVGIFLFGQADEHFRDRGDRMDHRFREISKFVESFDLGPELETALMDRMRAFHPQMRGFKDRDDAFKRETLGVFASPGVPSDEFLAERCAQIGEMKREKSLLVLTHFRGIKELLGDEKGREFFEEMIAHFLDRRRHR